MKQNNFLSIVLIMLFFSVNMNSQIVTFDFSSLTGSEVTASSSTNDANISSSIISRGAGLTASNNGGRFNANNWNTGSITDAITGDDYMEFTISPNTGVEFNITSIVVNVQRSGSGPGAISLRSSLDNYATNLGGEQTIVDNTSTQVFTFTFTQTAQTAITYRFYLHTAESTGGTGGFEGTGNDITVNGSTAIVSTNPTIGFDTTSSSVTETNTTFNTTIPVTLTNYDADVTVGVSVDASSTAEVADYALNTTSLSFTADGSQNISLDINDDVDSDNETLILNLTISSGTATISNSQHTITIADDDLPEIIISEFMYNTPSTDDEWIELYNNETSDVDISNWTLEFNGNTFAFPAATTFTSNTFIVIAVGSNGDGSYNNNNPFTPDYNNLSVTNDVVKDTNDTNNLGNATGSITLKNSIGSTVDVVTYDDGDASSTDGSGNSYELLNITGDNSSTANNWQASTVLGGSPASESPFVWTGTTDNDWNTIANWANNALPNSTSTVLIPSGLTNYPTASSAITVNSLTIESGASFIALSTVTGTVTYKRNLPTTNWYLISSPVIGQTLQDLIADPTFDYATGIIDTDHIGFAYYNSNSSVSWVYQEATSTGSLTSGRGFITKLATPADVSYTGTMATDDVDVSVFNGTNNNFYMVGNPYPSYVNSATFTTENTAEFSEETIWIWNGTSYVTYNNATPIEIAPGQGFFVETATPLVTSIATFTEANQSHQTTDVFYRQEPMANFELFVESNDAKMSTKVFYVDGKTTGSDKGYDSKMFDAIDYDFAVFTELITDNIGKKLAIQTLPNENLETMIVPVGVIAKAGEEITFSVASLNLPDNIEVYLEDRTNGEFVSLSDDVYTITLTEDNNGVGRFFIHTTSGKLSSTDIENLDNISIYKSAKQEITITGLQSEAKVVLFSLLGKKVLDTNLNSNGVSKVALPGLSNGVYIIKVIAENGEKTKKIILD